MTARENFPVGSRLIRRDHRSVVLAFYRFARAADDIADDPLLSRASKLAALARFEAGLVGAPDGATEGRALAALGRRDLVRQAHQLLRAFRRDADGDEVATWADLLGYCEDSANPVGRFLLDLHGEGHEARGAADALCTALQVLNHVQDLGPDHRRLGRCYLPADWMAEEGAVPADLGAAALTPALRRVADRTLAACDDLLREAMALPRRLASRRLAGEVATILALAHGLHRRLRREDPLAGRVAPGWPDLAFAALRGLGVALGPRGRRARRLEAPGGASP